MAGDMPSTRVLEGRAEPSHTLVDAGAAGAGELSCAAWIARFLQARGIDRIFGLQGGHIQPIWDHAASQGWRW